MDGIMLDARGCGFVTQVSTFSIFSIMIQAPLSMFTGYRTKKKINPTTPHDTVPLPYSLFGNAPLIEAFLSGSGATFPCFFPFS